jgi:hypothetical protein
VAAIAAVATVAAARTVSTGDHTRFTRGGASAQHAYWASTTGAPDEVRILVYPYRKVSMGERFDLFGRTEANGRAEVVEATETVDVCPRYPYLVVRARLTEGTLDQNWGQMIAVSPASKGKVKGRSAMANYDNDSIDVSTMPPPGLPRSWVFSVDLDGDDDWDFVRYMYVCASGVSSDRWLGEGEGCIEDWHRVNGKWTQPAVERVVCR